jgi:hypothetical protein
MRDAHMHISSDTESGEDQLRLGRIGQAMKLMDMIIKGQYEWE